MVHYLSTSKALTSSSLGPPVTITNSRGVLATLNNGFYRRSSKIRRLFCHLGDSGQVNKICTFLTSQAPLYCCNNCSTVHGSCGQATWITRASIVSYRDTIFVSHFCKELFKLYKVNLQLSTAYHPQTDGQSERVNQCLEMYLRCAVNDSPKA